MNSTLYEDGVITVTENEIRGRGFVLYVDNVSSISVNTARPMKWFAVVMSVPIGIGALSIMAVGRMLGSIVGQQPSATVLLPLILFLPLAMIIVAAFFLRISRLFLQTTGGPVVLASKISLSDHFDTLRQYEAIKLAIEKAISSRRRAS